MGIASSAKIFKFFKDWYIEEKVFYITLKYASSNYSMQRFLKGKLNVRGLLLCDGLFFLCVVVHAYDNLIVLEGLNAIDELVSMIHKL